MPDEQSAVVDYRNLLLERKGLRIAIAAFVVIMAIVLVGDVVIWSCYGGLPTLDAALVAQGTFALPVVAAVAALGAGYGFFRNLYKGVPVFGDLPPEVKQAVAELASGPKPASAAPSGTVSATVRVSASNPPAGVDNIGEDKSAPSSGAGTDMAAIPPPAAPESTRPS